MDKSVHNISHNICTGCMMCGDLCCKHAISFKIENGFWFPYVNGDACINCGLCSQRCPAIHEVPAVSGPISCYGAKSKDENIRWNSTSGGFFSELAYSVIEDGGYCIGAIYGDDNEIVHSVESTKEGIDKLRQSKYAQSRTGGIYYTTKKILTEGYKVLFCGTACQVEALKSYLGKDFANLITMDFVCLGICSPIVYRKYLDYLESKYNSKVKKVWFKNKKAGWRAIGTQIEFTNGKVYFRSGRRDLFMVSFVGDSIAMRKNCESCKYRKIPHNSDFTVADFWGIENINPSMDDNKGVSAVFANTPMADMIFNNIKSRLYYFETDVESITRGNFSSLNPKQSGANRDAFLAAIGNLTLDKAISLYGTNYSGFNRIKVDLRYFRSLIINKIKKTWAG